MSGEWKKGAPGLQDRMEGLATILSQIQVEVLKQQEDVLRQAEEAKPWIESLVAERTRLHKAEKDLAKKSKK